MYKFTMIVAVALLTACETKPRTNTIDAYPKPGDTSVVPKDTLVDTLRCDPKFVCDSTKM